MTDAPLYVVERGEGPPVVLVHGSASDADAWAIQLRSLSRQFRVIAYDRRGTPRSPTGDDPYPVARHADDLIALVDERVGRDARVAAVGASFGAVCVLDAVRRYPYRFACATLCEPPLPPNDDGPLSPDAFRAEFARLYREEGGPAAAALFLRTVLGDAFDRLPPRQRDRLCTLHVALRLDSDALAAYRVDYPQLASVTTPILLMGGDRSAPVFAPTLAALAAALPNAHRQTLSGGSHMMHADAARQFNEVLVDFVSRFLKVESRTF